MDLKEQAMYIGPSIPGVATYATVFRAGATAAFREAMRACPALGSLLVPLADLPRARRELAAGTGWLSRQYAYAVQYVTQKAGVKDGI